MAVLAFLAAAVYWPGVAGAVTMPRWCLLALVVPWLIREQRVTASHLIGATLIAWAAVTLLWANNGYDGIGALLVLLVLASCFLLGNQLADLRRVWIGAGLGLALSSGIVLADWLGYPRFMPGPSLGGLFINRNFLAEAAALVAIAAIAERIYWLLPVLAPSLLFTQSRGALAAITAALAFQYRRLWPLIGLAGVILIVFVSLDKVDSGMSERWVIWESAWNGVTVFGRGIGSFWTAYPQFDLRTIVHDTPEQAHNELLTIAFELGIVGALIAVAFAASLAGSLNTARLVLIGVAVESITQFPLHMPTTAFLGMVAAGHAVRDAPLLRNFAMRRRIPGWKGSVGATI